MTRPACQAFASQARYEAGDHVGILAQNEDAVVERAAAALGLSPSMVFSLRLPAHNPHQLSLPFTGTSLICTLPPLPVSNTCSRITI